MASKASKQSISFLVPATEEDRVIAAIRKNFAHALIGKKAHDTDSVLLAVTLYADAPEAMLSRLSALGTDTSAIGAARPTATTLSALVAAIRQKQEG